MLPLRLLNGVGRERRAQEPFPACDDDPLDPSVFRRSGRLVHKRHRDFEIYQPHPARCRRRSPVVREIGPCHGGSLEMRRDYFGAGLSLFGIDADPRCRAYADATTTILIGNQADRAFLAEVRERVPRIDVLIDDGGHRMDEQCTMFEELDPHLADDGVYLCEDLHTSYWPSHGGACREPRTSVAFSKTLTDQRCAWQSRGPEPFRPDQVTRTAHSMRYYGGMPVIEKPPMHPPQRNKQGRPSF
jgi:hypothetical protein